MRSMLITALSNLCNKTSLGKQTLSKINEFLNFQFARKMNGIIPEKQVGFELNRIIWIDMEMTGLNIETDKIMEIACLVTDSNLNKLDEGINLVINQPPEILNNMNKWCKKHHAKTGLTQACLESTVSLEEAENRVCDFLNRYVPHNSCPLAGSTVYMDKLFLLKHMPKVCDILHYRIIDVSSIKELCERWNPEVARSAPKKEYNHRALEDILESIEELKYYKSNFLNVNTL